MKMIYICYLVIALISCQNNDYQYKKIIDQFFNDFKNLNELQYNLKKDIKIQNEIVENMHLYCTKSFIEKQHFNFINDRQIIDNSISKYGNSSIVEYKIDINKKIYKIRSDTVLYIFVTEDNYKEILTKYKIINFTENTLLKQTKYSNSVSEGKGWYLELNIHQNQDFKFVNVNRQVYIDDIEETIDFSEANIVYEVNNRQKYEFYGKRPTNGSS